MPECSPSEEMKLDCGWSVGINCRGVGGTGEEGEGPAPRTCMHHPERMIDRKSRSKLCGARSIYNSGALFKICIYDLICIYGCRS